MKYKWDLTTIYKKREDFYFDMTLIRDKIKKLNEHREIKVDGINLYNLMMECFSIREINAKTLLYGTLNYYLDIHDDEMFKMKNYAEDLDRFVFNETYFIEELIFIIEEEKLSFFYEECPDLEKYRFYIDKVRRNSKYLVSNSVIYYYIESINDNLIEYSSLIKNMDFGCVNGIKLDNSNIGVFLINEDRNIREISFGSLNSSYLSLGDKFFDIFNNIISLRRDLSLKKGFNSVLEEKLFNEDIEVKNVDNLIKGVNHYIYLLSRYLKIKGCFLGIESLCFYDINLPFINYYRSYDLDSAVDIFRCAFSLLGNEYVDSINYLINNNYFDLECNDKKHPSMTFSFGNYCFTNYKNRYFDIKNLAHELGYVVNNYLSNKNNIFVYSDNLMICGEVAAIVNEIILNDYLYKNAKNVDEKIFYLTKLIEGFISQVYRQTMYIEFENIVYDEDDLNLDFVSDSYLSLIKKYYGEVIYVNDEIKCEWMRIGFLFNDSYHMYKYVLGYVLGFYIVSKIKDIDKSYVDFLSSGSKIGIVDLLRKLDIDIYDRIFIDNSFELLNKYIDELEDLVK